MTKKVLFFSFFLMASVEIFLPGRSFSQGTAAPAPKGPTEKTFPADFDRVWGAVVMVLTEKGLSEHPHGKMSANMDGGKITTPIFRYFRISSARPVQEKDYRDSYSISVSSELKTKESEAKAKMAEANSKLEEAKDKEKTPEEVKTLHEEAKKLEAEGAKAAAEAKAAAAKPKAVKVQIQRKFEVYDPVTKKAWVEADPSTENVGITEEALMAAIDAKLASAAPTEVNLETVSRPNLNMTPPIYPEDSAK